MKLPLDDVRDRLGERDDAVRVGVVGGVERDAGDRDPVAAVGDDDVLRRPATSPPTTLPADEMFTPSSWLGIDCDHGVQRLLTPMRLPSTTLPVPLVYGVTAGGGVTMIGITPST